MKSLPKYILTIILTSAVIFFSYWLWQRQPKKTTPQPETKVTQDEIIKSDDENIVVKTTPEDGAIVDNNALPLTIKTSAQNYFAVSATADNPITKTDDKGQAKVDLKLSDGLNIVKVTVFNRGFSKTFDKQIAIYLKPAKKNVDAKILAAGTVKNLFEDVVTITTFAGDKNIKTKGAKVASPSPSPVSKSKSPNPAEQKFRVGDFLLVLGNPASSDQIEATSIEIFRDNKPQLTKEVSIVKILSKVKDNSFSVKVEKGNNIEEFSLPKDPAISKDGQKGNNNFPSSR